MTKLNPKLNLHKSRLKVLAEIDRLNKTRCNSCSSEVEGNSYDERSKCNCPAAVKVRKLGTQLDKLVTPRKIILEDIPALVNIEGLTLDSLTVAIYKNMKVNKMTDLQISRHLKVNPSKVSKWRHGNGLNNKAKIVEGEYV